MDQPLEHAPAFAHPWSSIKPALLAPITDTLQVLGFARMTPVQATVIPLSLQNKDVVVEAVTGSGKTLAYAVPLLQRLLVRHNGAAEDANLPIGGIVIAPTRELARQIMGVFAHFTPFLPSSFRLQLIVGGAGGGVEHTRKGGADAGKQRDQTAGDYKEIMTSKPVILITTPGRFNDLLQRFPTLSLAEVDSLILDEADRLLDLGFSGQINHIISRCPKQRRTALFSATMTDAVEDLVRLGLRNPARVVVRMEYTTAAGNDKDDGDDTERRTPSTLQIGYLVCRADRKFVQLVRLLLREPGLKHIVYFATCACVEYFTKVMSKLPQLKEYNIVGLHGKMDTKKRTGSYSKFANSTIGESAVLLCTDIAARGLDLPDVDRVIQFDAPQDPRTFSHRCGRTARAGRRGRALVLLLPGSEEVFPEFMRIRKIPMMPHPYIGADGALADGSFTETDQRNIGDVDDDADVLVETVRNEAASDRDIYEKGVTAFVSWIKSYAKHELSYIFRIKELDFAQSATGFGLLKLPRMPELKGQPESELSSFRPWNGDLNAIPYIDPIRETQRQKRLVEKASQPLAESKKRQKTEAWSKSREAKKKRMENREKRANKRDARMLAEEKQNQAMIEAERNKAGAKSEQDEDWAEIQREERLAKKMRKGKISKEDFVSMVDGDGFDDL